MRSTIQIREVIYCLATPEDAFKLQEVLARFDRLSMPTIRITDPLGHTSAFRLGESDHVTVTSGALDEDARIRICKELDESPDITVVDVAAAYDLRIDHIAKSWAEDSERDAAAGITDWDKDLGTFAPGDD